MPTTQKPVTIDREVISINLKWVHLLLVVVAGILSVAITFVTLTNRYIDHRISYHINAHEVKMQAEVTRMHKEMTDNFDSMIETQKVERKEQIKELREDLNYIRNKLDAIYEVMARR